MTVFFFKQYSYDFITETFLIKNNNNELPSRIMRGGLPLIPRSAKRRFRKSSKIGLRSLQTGLVISLAFLCTSQQIGSTYGGFTDSSQTKSEIGFCAVFPASLKQQLLQFKGHVDAAALLAASLKDYSFNPDFQGAADIESMSLAELDAAEQQLTEQLTGLQSGLEQVNAGLNANLKIWNDIALEINAAAAELAVIGGYMANMDPNCLEIRDEQFFNEFENNLNQSGVLSESLSASLNGIIEYLQSLHDPGIPYTVSVSDIVYGPQSFNRELPVQPFPFLIAVHQPGGNISDTLAAAYDGLSSSLNSLKNSAAAGITELQSQKQLISQTRSKRLEEMEQARLAEQAKKDEEAQQALAKQQEAEAKDKAKAEEKAAAEAAARPETPEDPADPAGSGLQVPSATPAPAASETPEVTEAPVQEPQTTESPAPASDDSDSQQVKGGDE